MVHRITLVVGAFVAMAILAYGAGQQSMPTAVDSVSAADVVAEAPAPDPTADQATAGPQTVTDTVYVLPTPEQQVIHVTQQAPPAATPAPTPTTRTTRTRHRQGDDSYESEHEGGEHEGGGD
jgi:hypothetical protein